MPRRKTRKNYKGGKWSSKPRSLSMFGKLANGANQLVKNAQEGANAVQKAAAATSDAMAQIEKSRHQAKEMYQQQQQSMKNLSQGLSSMGDFGRRKAEQWNQIREKQRRRREERRKGEHICDNERIS